MCEANSLPQSRLIAKHYGPTAAMTKLLVQLVCVVCLVSFVRATASTCPEEISIAVGSYTNISWIPEAAGEGVTLLKLTNSSLSRVAIFPVESGGRNPTFLAVAPPHIFVANSNDPGGEVTRISFSGSAPLVEIDSALSQTPSTTHISLLPSRGSRKIVLSVSYDGGSIMSFISSSRKLVEADVYTVPKKLASQVKFPDLSPQQAEPHPHMILPYGEGALVSDLGTDLIYYMGISRETGELSLMEKIKLRPGDGVRHLAKHPTLDVVYAVNEISLSAVVLRKSCGKKVLGECNRVQVANASDADEVSLAAIRVSADGRFLYVSVRLGDEDGLIVGYKLKEKTGDIARKIGQWSSGGARPRDFFIVGPVQDRGKCRSFVAVANRGSDNLSVFERDEQSGRLDGNVAYDLDIGTPASVVQY